MLSALSGVARAALHPAARRTASTQQHPRVPRTSDASATKASVFAARRPSAARGNAAEHSKDANVRLLPLQSRFRDFGLPLSAVDPLASSYHPALAHSASTPAASTFTAFPETAVGADAVFTEAAALAPSLDLTTPQSAPPARHLDSSVAYSDACSYLSRINTVRAYDMWSSAGLYVQTYMSARGDFATFPSVHVMGPFAGPAAAKLSAGLQALYTGPVGTAYSSTDDGAARARITINGEPLTQSEYLACLNIVLAAAHEVIALNGGSCALPPGSSNLTTAVTLPLTQALRAAARNHPLAAPAASLCAAAASSAGASDAGASVAEWCSPLRTLSYDAGQIRPWASERLDTSRARALELNATSSAESADPASAPLSAPRMTLAACAQSPVPLSYTGAPANARAHAHAGAAAAAEDGRLAAMVSVFPEGLDDPAVALRMEDCFLSVTEIQALVALLAFSRAGVVFAVLDGPAGNLSPTPPDFTVVTPLTGINCHLTSGSALPFGASTLPGTHATHVPPPPGGQFNGLYPHYPPALYTCLHSTAIAHRGTFALLSPLPSTPAAAPARARESRHTLAALLSEIFPPSPRLLTPHEEYARDAHTDRTLALMLPLELPKEAPAPAAAEEAARDPIADAEAAARMKRLDLNLRADGQAPLSVLGAPYDPAHPEDPFHKRSQQPAAAEAASAGVPGASNDAATDTAAAPATRAAPAAGAEPELVLQPVPVWPDTEWRRRRALVSEKTALSFRHGEVTSPMAVMDTHHSNHHGPVQPASTAAAAAVAAGAAYGHHLQVGHDVPPTQDRIGVFDRTAAEHVLLTVASALSQGESTTGDPVAAELVSRLNGRRSGTTEERAAVAQPVYPLKQQEHSQPDSPVDPLFALLSPSAVGGSSAVDSSLSLMRTVSNAGFAADDIAAFLSSSTGFRERPGLLAPLPPSEPSALVPAAPATPATVATDTTAVNDAGALALGSVFTALRSAYALSGDWRRSYAQFDPLSQTFGPVNVSLLRRPDALYSAVARMQLRILTSANLNYYAPTTGSVDPFLSIFENDNSIVTGPLPQRDGYGRWITAGTSPSKHSIGASVPSLVGAARPLSPAWAPAMREFDLAHFDSVYNMLLLDTYAGPAPVRVSSAEGDTGSAPTGSVTPTAVSVRAVQPRSGPPLGTLEAGFVPSLRVFDPQQPAPAIEHHMMCPVSVPAVSALAQSLMDTPSLAPLVLPPTKHAFEFVDGAAQFIDGRLEVALNLVRALAHLERYAVGYGKSASTYVHQAEACGHETPAYARSVHVAERAHHAALLALRPVVLKMAAEARRARALAASLRGLGEGTGNWGAVQPYCAPPEQRNQRRLREVFNAAVPGGAPAPAPHPETLDEEVQSALPAAMLLAARAHLRHTAHSLSGDLNASSASPLGGSGSVTDAYADEVLSQVAALRRHGDAAAAAEAAVIAAETLSSALAAGRAKAAEAKAAAAAAAVTELEHAATVLPEVNFGTHVEAVTREVAASMRTTTALVAECNTILKAASGNAGWSVAIFTLGTIAAETGARLSDYADVAPHVAAVAIMALAQARGDALTMADTHARMLLRGQTSPFTAWTEGGNAISAEGAMTLLSFVSSMADGAFAQAAEDMATGAIDTAAVSSPAAPAVTPVAPDVATGAPHVASAAPDAPTGASSVTTVIDSELAELFEFAYTPESADGTVNTPLDLDEYMSALALNTLSEIERAATESRLLPSHRRSGHHYGPNGTASADRNVAGLCVIEPRAGPSAEPAQVISALFDRPDTAVTELPELAPADARAQAAPERIPPRSPSATLLSVVSAVANAQGPAPAVRLRSLPLAAPISVSSTAVSAPVLFCKSPGLWSWFGWDHLEAHTALRRRGHGAARVFLSETLAIARAPTQDPYDLAAAADAAAAAADAAAEARESERAATGADGTHVLSGLYRRWWGGLTRKIAGVGRTVRALARAQASGEEYTPFSLAAESGAQRTRIVSFEPLPQWAAFLSDFAAPAFADTTTSANVGVIFSAASPLQQLQRMPVLVTWLSEAIPVCGVTGTAPQLRKYLTMAAPLASTAICSDAEVLSGSTVLRSTLSSARAAIVVCTDAGAAAKLAKSLLASNTPAGVPGVVSADALVCVGSTGAALGEMETLLGLPRTFHTDGDAMGDDTSEATAFAGRWHGPGVF